MQALSSSDCVTMATQRLHQMFQRGGAVHQLPVCCCAKLVSTAEEASDSLFIFIDSPF